MDTKELEKAISHFEEEIKKIKTGRADPSLIEDLRVEVYGAQMPLKELATISLPEARQFLIKPFDPKTVLKAIEGALAKADLGAHPNTEDNQIRLILPPLTEETRQDSVKKVKERAEQARVKIRDLRHKALDEIKKDIKSEDQQAHKEKDVEETVKTYNEKIDQISQAKEKELMSL